MATSSSVSIAPYHNQKKMTSSLQVIATSLLKTIGEGLIPLTLVWNYIVQSNDLCVWIGYSKLVGNVQSLQYTQQVQ